MEFQYKAKDEEGRTITGVLEADDEDALATALDGRNLVLVEAGPAKKKDAGVMRAGRIKARDVLNFTLDMSSVKFSTSRALIRPALMTPASFFFAGPASTRTRLRPSRAVANASSSSASSTPVIVRPSSSLALY